MNTIANTIISIHTNLAELIAILSGWTVDVANDDAGIYISMTKPDHSSTHRGLSLASAEDKEDLSEYRWQFWNETEGIWFDSTLGVDADNEEVLGFLKDCLAEEVLPIGAVE